MAKKVACLLGEDFEDSEFRQPFDALRRAGFEVDIIGPEEGPIRGKHGKETVHPTVAINKAPAAETYDALFIPGGYSPDHLRSDSRFVNWVKRFAALDRPLFAICHGPQLLMAAGVVGEGRSLTAWRTVQGDLRYTGADVRDESVVVDGNWVTSRQPSDLPMFCDAIVQMMEAKAPEPRVEEGRPGPH